MFLQPGASRIMHTGSHDDRTGSLDLFPEPRYREGKSHSGDFARHIKALIWQHLDDDTHLSRTLSSSKTSWAIIEKWRYGMNHRARTIDRNYYCHKLCWICTRRCEHICTSTELGTLAVKRVTSQMLRIATDIACNSCKWSNGKLYIRSLLLASVSHLDPSRQQFNILAVELVCN